MITTIALGLFSVFFAYAVKFKNGDWGLKISFTLIFLFLALRYNFGNDYKNYVTLFHGIAQSEIVDYTFFISQYYEPGWVFLNWLFRDFGFFSMVAVLAFFSSIIYYRFIKKYVPANFYWLAVFLYIFYPSFMLLHSSAMRQSVAIMIFVFSLDYIVKKQAIRYILCIGFASLFHFTALFLLPVYFLVNIKQKINEITGGVIVAVYVLLFLFAPTLSPIVKGFIHSISDKFDLYKNEGNISSGLGFIYYSALFVVILYYEKMQAKQISVVFKIAVVGFLIMPLSLILEMIGRFGMYFTPATIIAYPNILENSQKSGNKIIFSTVLILFTLYQFFQFFYSDIYQDFFMNYHTIFSAPKWS